MSKILITGGAGFIGSHLAENLIRQDHEVVIVDNMDPYYSVKIKEKNLNFIEETGSFTLIKGDITDRDAIKKLIEDGVEYIFHEAAQPGVRASVIDPIKPYNVNITGTLNVLEAARKSGVKRVINASSSSVYGKVEYLPFDEKHPTQPISPYGVSKLAAELYCKVYNDIYGLPTVSLRYFTVYGPRMRPDLAIPIFTKALMEGKSPTIFGDGKQTRDLTFIDDIISANLRLLDSSKADGEVINVGGGKRIDVNQLYGILMSLIECDIEPIYGDVIKGDAKHTLSNIDKARQLIGYEPTTSIEKGLKRFFEWYKANMDFYVD